MKIYTCTRTFKTTLFKGKETPERIEIKEGTDWFLEKKESDDRVVLCNNKIELIIAESVLKGNFELTMQ